MKKKIRILRETGVGVFGTSKKKGKKAGYLAVTETSIKDIKPVKAGHGTGWTNVLK